MRSKTLLASGILASVYSVILLWLFIGLTIVDAGGNSIIHAVGGFFESFFEIFNMDLAIINYLYVLSILLLVHIGLFTVGSIVTWVAFAVGNHTVALIAAVAFLAGTVCSPLCFIIGLPLTVLAFVGVVNQKKINEKGN